jgi:hypothetical protein
MLRASGSMTGARLASEGGLPTERAAAEGRRTLCRAAAGGAGAGSGVFGLEEHEQCYTLHSYLRILHAG